MNGYVYKHTIRKTGKWYIGSHNGNNPNYKGSGLLWSRALSKYGDDSYDTEMLYEGKDFRNQEEIMLKNLNAKNDPMSYNMKNEALGGSFPGELNGMYGKKLSKEHRLRCGNAFRGKKRPEHSIKISLNKNGRYKDGRSFLSPLRSKLKKEMKILFTKQRVIYYINEGYGFNQIKSLLKIGQRTLRKILDDNNLKIKCQRTGKKRPEHSKLMRGKGNPMYKHGKSMREEINEK